MKGTTKSGFSFDVDENVINNYRYVKTAARLKRSQEPADRLELFDILTTMVLPDEEQERLFAHLEKKDGIAATDAVIAEVNEIIEIIAEKVKSVKNS